MNKRTKDPIIIGLALFAIFFGAGNLIFPPALGLKAGLNFKFTLGGFLLTGVGMPLFGIMAVAKAGGSLEKLCCKINHSFGKVIGTIIIIAIGPLLAIPRTGATTFEMGIKPLLPNSNPIIISVIFFLLTLLFSIKPSKVIDNVGKILTPILLLVLAIIIFKGIKFPIGQPISTNITNSFSYGFLGGYQTMDAIGSIVMAGLVLNTIIDKGYKDIKDQISVALKSSLVAGLGLGLVYGGLLYLGATGSSVFNGDIEKTLLLISITKNILGSFGTIALAICVTLACLTTSVGLTATVGNYFNDLSKGKVSYKVIVITTTIFSGILANIGVENIIKISVPILGVLYPVVIVLIIMNLFDDLIINKKAYIGAVYGALIISFLNVLKDIRVRIYIVEKFINLLPFSAQGFSWLVPSIVGGLIFGFFVKNKK
ncbi:branched-chain amino acid transport system II carrier protein [Haloimpatiens sp. FM7315]|uniref:branched-chain amino acid transport system II carrier protein n=1 Tax=Haloimpatiens sp. FM7315 TaxID=3298609 RepID=UPI00370A4D13